MTTSPPSRPVPTRALSLALLAVLGGCAGAAPPFDAAAMVQDWAEFMQRDHVLQPGDLIAVSGYQSPELTQEVPVSPSGTVNLKRLPDSIRAAGLTMAAFRAHVQDAYTKAQQVAEISVSLVRPSATSVFVAGEVKRPGVVPHIAGMTLSQAIGAAGGFDITAKVKDVRVLRNGTPGKARTYRVNMEDVLYEGADDFILLPGDVVHCQTSAIADVGAWVELYIRRLIPLPGAGPTLLPF